MARARPPLPEGPFLIVGLARSGVAAAEALAARGERLYGTDSGDPSDAGRLARLGVEVSLDGDGTELLDRVNAVVKSPGVPADAPVIAAARAAGKEVLGELELGWRLSDQDFVAVTGTNGKTTVSEWLGHVWRVAGLPVAVAGNVGTPVSSMFAPAAGLDPNATVVCECSSFQLEDSVAFAPEVAVLLNVTPDHLDRHGGFEGYREAKLKIFAAQREDDAAVTDADEESLHGIEIPGAARQLHYGISGCAAGDCDVWLEDGSIHDADGPLIDAGRVSLAGEHNLRNAMAVATAALAAGVPRDAVAEGLASFNGVPHRLQRVRVIDGVAYVNDSKATNPAAAIAALRSFPGGIHVIMGGSLKGGGFEQLRDPVSERCRVVYLIGEAADQLAADLGPAGVELVRCDGLADAVAAASARAQPGETVLLAPACASFDAFRDYEHRGDEFARMVGDLDGGDR